MKEHPILFTAEMVRAILDGRKTQTRRVIKPQPGDYDGIVRSVDGPWYGWQEHTAMPFDDIRWKCPYGKPGDRLWVRETIGYFTSPQRRKGIGKPDKDWKIEFVYKADDPTKDLSHLYGWTPSIHMPRWASRILLEVTDVRVERVRDIKKWDAVAEGLPHCETCNSSGEVIEGDAFNGISRVCPECRMLCETLIEKGYKDIKPTKTVALIEPWTARFAMLWDSINAKRGFGWDVNPWVWVVEFKIVACMNWIGPASLSPLNR